MADKEPVEAEPEPEPVTVQISATVVALGGAQ